MTRDFANEEFAGVLESHGLDFELNKQKPPVFSEYVTEEGKGKARGLLGTHDEMSYHLQLIMNEYKRRAAKNPRYSLRAYASFLNLDPSALSRILAGKQELSVKAGISIVKRLQMSDDEGRKFLLSLIDGRRRNEAARVGRVVSSPNLRPVPAYISPDVFEKVADLNALALLELTQTDDFRSEPEWIAARLEIPAEEAKELIQRLVDVGLLKTENGRLMSVNSYWVAAGSEKTKQVRQNLHERAMKKALHSLKKTGPEQGLFLGMTMAIDASKIEVASRRIREFLENLNDELSTSPRTEVYHLAVQLYPLTASERPGSELH
mgnify:CR=1 FL=1